MIRSNLSLVVAASTLAVNLAVHDNKTILLSAAGGTAVTLPAALASQIGKKVKFMVAVASNANTIATSPTTDVFAGALQINDIGDSAAATMDAFPTASNSNKISPTTVAGGGIVGDWIEVEVIAAGVWAVRGVLGGATDPATPFSHV